MDLQTFEDLLGLGAFAPAARYALLNSKSTSRSSELLELLNQKANLKSVLQENSDLVSETPKLLERLVELDQDINQAILQKTRERSFLPFLLTAALLTILVSPVLVKLNSGALNEGVFGNFAAKSILFLALALMAMLIIRLVKGKIETRTNSTFTFTLVSTFLFSVAYLALVYVVVWFDPFTKWF